MDWEIQRGKKRKPGQATPMIKWRRLKEDNLKVQLREKVLDKVRPVESSSSSSSSSSSLYRQNPT